LREFHIDGLRVDAVTSMIYDGSFENISGINFIGDLNTAISKEFPDVLLIAEESTNYGKTTLPLSSGGLGFSMKWNMGWSHDFYDYISTDPVFRKYKHKALSFPIHYAFKERYCLPLSHDDFINGKKSLIDKAFGSVDDKFCNLRLAMMLMMTYPGKKLSFMGTEFAQFKEWGFNNELEWFMLNLENHRKFNDYVIALNHFYLYTPELWDIDFSPEGFKWIYSDESEKNIVAFRRISKIGNEIIVAMNFSGINQEIFIPIASNHEYHVIFATDENSVSHNINSSLLKDCSGLHLSIPRLSGIILRKKD
jgi:1,4-alpha-glucan branching enzyme